MTGQDAVNSAREFNERLELDGVILTKFDSDARGGAALSVKTVTGKPIKFIGVGEKVADLEPFHPQRMAGRILGMGDIVSLVERAQTAVDADKAEQVLRKIVRQEFNLEDFREQMIGLKNMGPMDKLLALLPGGRAALKGLQVGEDDFKPVVAIIDSMTPQERRQPRIDRARFGATARPRVPVRPAVRAEPYLLLDGKQVLLDGPDLLLLFPYPPIVGLEPDECDRLRADLDRAGFFEYCCK
jgi:signal recognition particle GTPase